MPAEGKEGTTMRNVIKNYFLEEDAIGVVTSVVTKAFTNFTSDTGKILA